MRSHCLSPSTLVAQLSAWGQTASKPQHRGGSWDLVWVRAQEPRRAFEDRYPVLSDTKPRPTVRLATCRSWVTLLRGIWQSGRDR